MRLVLGALVAIAALDAWMPIAAADPGQPGIGVIGDSYSDEYVFYPPHRSLARNWVEILATLRQLDFGPYSEVSRGEPRNAGYAYNWARSGATTDDMIAQGQHTGVAEQAARGEVGLVCVFIGGNDFLEALGQPDVPAALAEATERAASNLEQAVQTILDASSTVRVLLATLPDLRDLPELADANPDRDVAAAHTQAVARAILGYNGRVWLIARDNPRIDVVDLHLTTRLAQVLAPRAVYVGGRAISRAEHGDTVEHVFLGDRRHIGTVVQGLLARTLVTAINRHRDGAPIEPLTDSEILDIAYQAAQGPPNQVATASTSPPPRSGGEAQQTDNR